LIKNLTPAEVVRLADLVAYQPGQVVSQTLAQNDGGGLTLFAFPEGEGLSKHTSPADALVMVLDGEALIEIDDKPLTVAAGESIVMPANVPHALQAKQPFKMLLVLVKD